MSEAWLGGPVTGVPPLLQPAAHALLNAKEQIHDAISNLGTAELTARPGDIASIAYHVRHAAGSLDRLFTYARGQALSDTQRQALESEKRADPSEIDAAGLLDLFDRAVDRAIDQLRSTDEKTLLDHRAVGRAGLPSTVMGLLFHGGEHSVRHAGQVVTTAKLVRRG